MAHVESQAPHESGDVVNTKYPLFHSHSPLELTEAFESDHVNQSVLVLLEHVSHEESH